MMDTTSYDRLRITGWLLAAAAVGLIVSGLTGSLTWLHWLGYEHLNVNYPFYAQHARFMGIALVLAGTAILAAILFQRKIRGIWTRMRPYSGKTLWVFLLLVALVLGFIAHGPFRAFPFCMDEYNYWYQARIFAGGDVYLESFPEKFRPFVEKYVILNEGRVFSKYPPGFPALLALGVIIKAPAVINPLIAVITLMLLFLFVRSFFGPLYALLAAALMAANPYFLAYSSSYFSQPAALLGSTLSFYLVRNYELSSKTLYLPALGLVTGYAALTRPLDAFCVIVPAYLYLLYILTRQKRFWHFSYPVATFGLLFAFLLLYNYYLVGKAGIAVYPIARGEFVIKAGHAQGVVQNLIDVVRFYYRNAIACIPRLLGTHLLVPTGFFIPLAAIFGVWRFKSGWRWVLSANFFLLVLMYNFHPGLGWPQYGARYYYSGFFAMVFLATAALRHFFSRWGSGVLGYYAVVVVFTIQAVFSVTTIWEYSHRFKVSAMVWEDIERHCPKNSIVLLDRLAVNPRNSALLSEANYLSLNDFRRNPFLNGPRLITKKNRKLPPGLLRSQFPQRTICTYGFDVLREKPGQGATGAAAAPARF